MRWNATFAMAVGGMVGGGIFSVLGVVLDLAGPWFLLSFALAGAIGFLTATSYAGLAREYGEGGAFRFLHETGRGTVSGLLSWLLVAGYVLTIGVYAYTFGHYVVAATGGGAAVERVVGAAVVAALTLLNLRGVQASARAEVVAVWTKLAVLALLAVVGIARWAPHRIGDGAPSHGATGVLVGAAAIFMAYQGFELLTYDYDDIRDPRRTLPRAMLPAVLTTVAIYCAVGLAAAMLVGGGRLVERGDVALAVAGQAAAGDAGRVVVCVAAALSAASAINATLFATARLCRRIAGHGELPEWLASTTCDGVPARGVVVLGVCGAVLAAAGGLGVLVEAASTTFLVTFAVVNAVAARRLTSWRWASALGAVAATLAAVVVVVRLAVEEPFALVALGALTVAAAAARRWTGRRGPDVTDASSSMSMSTFRSSG
ncbi:MAG TPA: APC family permease [Mycobacteriales bacterium]|jgi:hypothetical protein|nr:APC family permease [Mycobacteriales bacterium]